MSALNLTVLMLLCKPAALSHLCPILDENPTAEIIGQIARRFPDSRTVGFQAGVTSENQAFSWREFSHGCLSIVTVTLASPLV
jgi:hypothetical protein